MATLKQKIEYAKANPQDPDSLGFVKGLVAGHFNEEAFNEGLDLGAIKTGSGEPIAKSFNEFQVSKNIEEQDPSRLEKFSRGFAKSGLRTAEGIFQFGKKFTDKIDQAIGLDPQAPENLFGDKLTEEIQKTRGGEKAGVITGDIAQFAVPGGAAARATKGSRFLTRAGGQVASDIGVSTLQSGGDAREVATAGAGSAAFSLLGPVGKLVKNVGGRALKGLGAGLSGKPGGAIDAILENPKVAKEQFKKLTKGGKEAVMKDMNERVKIIRDGFTNVRKESSEAFGKGIDELKSKVKVDPATLNKNLTETASSFGVNPGDTVEEILDNSDFLSKPIANRVKKVNDILEGSDKFSGDKVREVFKTLEGRKFKTTGSDSEKIAFNKYIDEMTGTIERSLIDADDTGILKQINADFSADRQLLDAFESIFGKVKFKNIDEALKASNKFDQLFKQKGIGDDVIDRFFTRIGVDPSDFRAKSSVTESFVKDTPANAKGLSIGELIQTATSSVITPETVTRVSANLGIANDVASRLLKNLKGLDQPTRALFIDTLQDLFTGNNQ